MAGDFLQSNKYSPSSLTEGFLKKIREKMTKKSQDRSEKTDKEDQKPQSDCSNEEQTDILESSHCDELGEKSEGKDEMHISCATGNDKSKASLTLSHETRFPKLKQILFNGLVRIARPPSNPKPVPEPNSDTSSSTKTEETAISMIASFPPEETSGSSSQIHTFGEVGSLEVSAEMPCHQNDIDSDHKQHSEPANITQLENFMSNNNSESRPNSPTTFPDTACAALQCLSNLTVATTEIHEQKDPFEKTSTEDQVSQMLRDRIDETSKIKENINIPVSDSLYKFVNADANGTINFPLDDYSNVNTSQSLLYKTIDLLGSTEKNLSESNVSNYSEINAVQESENALMDCVKADTDISSEKNSRKGKPFPNILQILFDLRLKIRYKEDDTEPLVEEEIFEDANSQDEEKEQKIKKKSSSFKLSLSGHERKTGEVPRRPSLIVAAKRKRKKPRKKVMYRAGRHLKNKLDKGCRNVGYGFSYLVTEVPESPPKRINDSNKNLDATNDDVSYSSDAEDCTQLQRSPKKHYITLDYY